MSLALGVPASDLGELLEARDLAQYIAFERVFGPLTVQERVDIAGANAAHAAAAAAGNKAPLDKFIPQWGADEARPVQSVDSMIAAMRRIQHGKRGKA